MAHHNVHGVPYYQWTKCFQLEYSRKKKIYFWRKLLCEENQPESEKGKEGRGAKKEVEQGE